MIFTSLVVTLLSTGSLVAAEKGTLGWALGNTNTDGSCKQQSDYEQDFDALKGTGSTLVRTYSSGGNNCNTAANILPAAKSKGFKVLLGSWPDTDESFNADKQALQSAVPGNEDAVYGITVGSETLYRGNFTGEELLGKIQEVQHMFPSVMVGTADSWNKWTDGTGDAVIKGGVKLILANAFSFWQAQPIQNATKTYFDDIMQATAHIQEVANCIDCVTIMNGETGWPGTGGTPYGPAQASDDQMKTFWKSGVCGMLDWGMDLFFFEAMDEPGKPDSIGADGKPANEQHWGAFSVDRKPKFDMSC
ncbi:MAG: hypothetical protein Q9227_002813 [Pyrenula ochraceoflavens]